MWHMPLSAGAGAHRSVGDRAAAGEDAQCASRSSGRRAAPAGPINGAPSGVDTNSKPPGATSSRATRPRPRPVMADTYVCATIWRKPALSGASCNRRLRCKSMAVIKLVHLGYASTPQARQRALASAVLQRDVQRSECAGCGYVVDCFRFYATWPGNTSYYDQHDTRLVHHAAAALLQPDQSRPPPSW
jgi:hypothetical protein